MFSMIEYKKVIQSIFFLIFFLLLNGCHDKQDTSSKIPRSQNTDQIAIERPKPAIRLADRTIYFADLLQKNHYRVLNQEYQQRLVREPKVWLRYDDFYGKPKSIFQHPFETPVANTIVFIDIPLGATQLRYSIGVFSKDCEKSSDGVLFRIALQDQEKQNVLFEENLKIFDEWKDYVLDLSTYSGKTVTIEFMTEPGKDPTCDWAFWGTPRLFQMDDNTNDTEGDKPETVDSTSAKLYTAPVSMLYPELKTTSGDSVVRGWIPKSFMFDILLANVGSQIVLRNELWIIEKSDNQAETVTIEILGKNDQILDTSKHAITAQNQVIVAEYQVKNQERLPTKVRIQRDYQNPSTILIKEPIRYALRDSNDEKGKPDVILISLDTLRADHLSCYGYPSIVSPNIDALAAEAFVFTNAYSNANWTLPSHTSLFTSRYLVQHQSDFHSWSNGQWLPYVLPEHYITESLQQLNYVTIGLTGGGWVDSRFGFNRGFDYYIENITEFNPSTLDMLSSLIEPHNQSPLFLFLHTYEIHDYFKEKEFHRQYVQAHFDKIPNISLLKYIEAQMRVIDPRLKQALLPQPGIQYIRELYDGGINYTDTLLGQLFEELRGIGVYDTSWIIVTADHGEGFGDPHNNNLTTSWHHGSSLYNDQTRIPLIIKPPRALIQDGLKPRKIETFVQLIDISPTLLSILGEQTPDQFAGHSLFPLLTDPSAVFTEHVFIDDILLRQFAVLSQEYKLIASPWSFHLLTGDLHYELYQMPGDPSEQNNLVSDPKYAPILNELKQLLVEHIQDLPLMAERNTPPLTQRSREEEQDKTVDPQHIQRLKDLGYL